MVYIQSLALQLSPICFFQTIKFKSYLLSLGIADPVTRDTHGTGDRYLKELAKQISIMLQTPLKVMSCNVM